METKNRIKLAGKISFLLYIFALIYFLFISERIGGISFQEREYHYNLVPFLEIKRFWNYRQQLGVMAVLANLVGNVAGFLPFGLILPIISRNARGFFFITFTGFLLSLCVEAIQLVTKLGCFDVDDLIMNTMGAAAGYLIFAFSHWLYRKYWRK